MLAQARTVKLPILGDNRHNISSRTLQKNCSPDRTVNHSLRLRGWFPQRRERIVARRVARGTEVAREGLLAGRRSALLPGAQCVCTGPRRVWPGARPGRGARRAVPLIGSHLEHHWICGKNGQSNLEQAWCMLGPIFLQILEMCSFPTEIQQSVPRQIVSAEKDLHLPGDRGICSAINMAA